VQERQDVTELGLGQNTAPIRHAFVDPAVGDGMDEHLVHPIAVALIQMPQVSLLDTFDGVRAVV
jgi:hypothetical protein